MNKFRKRVFEKLAQTAEYNTETTPSVSGAPPAFNIQSLFPSIYSAYGRTIADYITSLSNYLNIALYYASDSKYNMLQLFNNSASIGTTNILDQDLKKLVEFSKLVIQYLYNNKTAFTNQLSTQDIAQRIDILDRSSQLNTLSNTNPSGQLATKVHGNIKTNIKAYLQYIKNSIPAGVAQPTR